MSQPQWSRVEVRKGDQRLQYPSGEAKHDWGFLGGNTSPSGMCSWCWHIVLEAATPREQASSGPHCGSVTGNTDSPSAHFPRSLSRLRCHLLAICIQSPQRPFPKSWHSSKKGVCNKTTSASWALYGLLSVTCREEYLDYSKNIIQFVIMTPLPVLFPQLSLNLKIWLRDARGGPVMT